MVGYDDGRKVSEYNPCTRTWRELPSLLEKRNDISVCTLDNKIFVLGGDTNTVEMFDMSDDDPEWRYVAHMIGVHNSGGAVVVKKKIYALGGQNTTNVEMYDVDQGKYNLCILGCPNFLNRMFLL